MTARPVPDRGAALFAHQFKPARPASVKPVLESLSALGQARLIEGGRFAA